MDEYHGKFNKNGFMEWQKGKLDQIYDRLRGEDFETVSLDNSLEEFCHKELWRNGVVAGRETGVKGSMCLLKWGSYQQVCMSTGVIQWRVKS